MRYGLAFIVFVLSFGLAAQDRCASKAPRADRFEIWLKKRIAENKASRDKGTKATLYQIPVVVHVFHKGEPVGSGVNLAEQRILAQIDSLNADFRRQNADAINTPTEFLPIAADIEIEFVLAKQDPEGNPTNGIIRLQGSRDVYRANSHRPLLRSESFWPASNYLNIYVLDLQAFLGYASFPLISFEGINNDPEDYIFDGVLVDYQYFGVNPSAPSFESFGRTLTHEIGHYLGLRHIWGDGGCTIDDFVDDTPVADNDNGDYTSPCTFPNPDDTQVCESGAPEMFQNYMDYTDDVCMNLFTQGQKTRMRTIMGSAINRTSLINSPGRLEPTKFANDLATVNILNPKNAICNTSIEPSVIVTNYGNNEITTYDIQLFVDGSPKGIPQTINTNLLPNQSDTITFGMETVSSSTTITFQTSGVNSTTDGNSSNNSISLVISSVNSTALPFVEDFEGTPAILGVYGSADPWELANAPKEAGTNQALVFKSHDNTAWHDERVIIKTPVMDLTGISAGDLLFSFAHANPPDEFYDGLMVKASVDCGETFDDVIFSSFGPDLATAGEAENYFIPSNQLDWIDTLINITDYKDIDGVQFAFVGINGSGNNIYLDNIQVLEANLFENDIKPISLQAPLLTCAESSNIKLNIRNNGSQTISSFEVKYYVNGDTSTTSFENLNISSRDFATFSLPAQPINDGQNSFGAEITLVNGISDQSITENEIQIDFIKDVAQDEYPLTVNFESEFNWVITADNGVSDFKSDVLGTNGVLKADGYNTTVLENKSWFISPKLNTGGLDSANLYFRASYASREGFNDRLQVLLSVDCGENYNTVLLNADSDSLASSMTTEEWSPSSDSDWKEYKLDLSHSFFFDDDIRIAFVFIPDGGNDLFIDDISIRGNDLPNYADLIRTYPNPATFKFNVGLNLPKKESVTIQLVDISGKVVFEDQIENAFNQILEYKAPSQEGLYFLNIVGNRFSTSQKLFINR